MLKAGSILKIRGRGPYGRFPVFIENRFKGAEVRVVKCEPYYNDIRCDYEVIVVTAKDYKDSYLDFLRDYFGLDIEVMKRK